MAEYFDKTFSNHHWGFPERFSTQHCLLVILDKRKRSIDKGHVFGTLLTASSSVFN